MKHDPNPSIWLRPGLALVLSLSALHAQDDAAFLRAAFQRLDADNDGVLQRKEFPGSDRQFAAIDTDKDGKATLAEFSASEVGKSLLRARYKNQMDAHARVTAAALAPRRFDWLLRADANKDGKVTRAEWTGTDEAFLQLDLDGNGVIDRRDRAEALAAAAAPPPPLPEPKGDLPAAEDLLRRFDRDGDGRLAGKELAEKWLQAALPFADRDGDGALAVGELRALLQAIGQRRAELAAANARPTPYEVPFDAWDKDKDGVLRSSEWNGPGNLFLAIDLDRDAGVSREELLRYKKRVLGEDFVARFDLDGDGKVTEAEFAGPPGAFRRADRNGDGVVNRADR